MFDRVIKPIETSYKGYRMRSRLEARWAVFFDELGFQWEYEPEGFDLGGGLQYLPDFKVYVTSMFPDDKGMLDLFEPRELYIEVKGNMDSESAEKVIRFSKHYPIVVLGSIPESVSAIPDKYKEPINGVYFFSAYHLCEWDNRFVMFFKWHGRNELIRVELLESWNSISKDYPEFLFIKDVLRETNSALQKARAARFSNEVR